MSVCGTVSKFPDEKGILAALSPFLLEVFRAHPNGRAVLWMESYEAEGGAAVTEIFATDEELRSVGTEHRLETRRHFLDNGTRLEPGAPPRTARQALPLEVLGLVDRRIGQAGDALAQRAVGRRIGAIVGGTRSRLHAVGLAFESERVFLAAEHVVVLALGVGNVGASELSLVNALERLIARRWLTTGSRDHEQQQSDLRERSHKPPP